MTATAEAALDFYRANLGLGEDPAGSNCNFISRWFGIGCVAWCAETVSRALNEAWGDPDTWQVPGVGSDYTKGTAYVPSLAGHFRKAGLYDRVPRVGSVAIYNWDGASAPLGQNTHTGLVEQVVGDGTFIALEGNHNDAIVRIRRSMQFVAGFGHPPYDQPTPTPPAHPKGLRPVFTYETGGGVFLAFPDRAAIHLDPDTDKAIRESDPKLPHFEAVSVDFSRYFRVLSL